MNEEWKDMVGINTDYQISNLGRIKKKSYIDKANKVRKEKIIYPSFSVEKRNYIFRINNRGKKYLIKKLVAQYFINNPENYPNVYFKDNDYTNLRADNLYWGEKFKKKERNI